MPFGIISTTYTTYNKENDKNITLFIDFRKLLC